MPFYALKQNVLQTLTLQITLLKEEKKCSETTENSMLFRGANKSNIIWNLEQRQNFFFLIVYIIFRPTHLAGLAPILTHLNSDAKNHIQLARCKPSFYNQNHFYFDSLPLHFKGWETIPWFCKDHLCFKHRVIEVLDQMTGKHCGK